MNKIIQIFLAFLVFFIITIKLHAQYSTPITNAPEAFLKTDNKANFDIKKIYPERTGLNVKIVESQSFNSGHIMDTIWRMVAQGMGHNATVVPQSIFNDTSFFSSTDILIISSGVITLPSGTPSIIKSFLMRKKNVYIQSEYQSSYSTNQAFASVVSDLGGVFSWGSPGTGQLSPMLILGTLSTTPNNVPSISYFWYGYSGNGNSTIENYMMYNSAYYGFVFTPLNTNYGILITNSDQDWVRLSTSLPLMQNILYKMSLVTGIKKIETSNPDEFSLSQNYPNPFNPTTNVRYDLPKSSFVKLFVLDALGRNIETLVNEKQLPGTYVTVFNASQYPSGVYFYKLITEKFSETKKMILIK